MSKTIAIKEDTHTKLTSLKGELIAILGKDVDFNDIIILLLKFKEPAKELILTKGESILKKTVTEKVAGVAIVE